MKSTQHPIEVEPEIQVERAIGKFPPVWERNVVFVANLLSLFFGNQRETEVLRRQVGALETYGGRLIPIIDLLFRGKQNLLILEGSSDALLCDYFENTLGLSLPTVEIASHDTYLSLLDPESELSCEAKKLLETVRNHPAEWIDGFVTDEGLVRLAELTGKKLMTPLEGSRRGNNKFLLHRYLASAGLPVFDTEEAETVAEVPGCLEKLAKRGYRRGVVKAQVGASGIGLLQVNLEAPEEVPDYLFHEGPCLVQGWLETAGEVRYLGSPSVQIFVRDEKAWLYDWTDQILSRASVHEGNSAPPGYLEAHPGLGEELLRQSEVAARWLHKQGYRGTASADFHVVLRSGKIEVRMCEINARVTGATYPSLLARTFRPEGAWLMRNIRFTQPYAGQILLKALEEACLLFRKDSESGILPVNFNLTRDGYVNKGQFLAIGADGEEVRELFRAVSNLEVLVWEYDRD